MEIKITVEDGLREVIESPGAMAQIEQVVLRKILDLKQAHWDKLSRQQVISRGFVGTEKS